MGAFHASDRLANGCGLFGIGRQDVAQLAQGCQSPLEVAIAILRGAFQREGLGFPRVDGERSFDDLDRLGAELAAFHADHHVGVIGQQARAGRREMLRRLLEGLHRSSQIALDSKRFGEHRPAFAIGGIAPGAFPQIGDRGIELGRAEFAAQFVAIEGDHSG